MAPRDIARMIRGLLALIVLSLVVGTCVSEGIVEPTTSTVAPSSTATTTTPRTTVTTTDPTAASQIPQDALRDGVIPELAALSREIRVDPIASVDTEEGVWVISRPSPDIEPYTEGCRLGADEGRYPTDFICTTEYGEVLLLDPVSGLIERAYPLPGIPPEVLIVGDEAVYCGRNGEGLLPDSMVCRIDRRTLQAVVRVFPGVPDSIVAQPCYYPPENWTIADRPLEVLDLQVSPDGLWAQDETGRIGLDPVSLEILEE
jgi:hypothetical protein